MKCLVLITKYPFLIPKCLITKCLVYASNTEKIQISNNRHIKMSSSAKKMSSCNASSPARPVYETDPEVLACNYGDSSTLGTGKDCHPETA